MREAKSVELRCDDRAENLVFTRYEYEPYQTIDSVVRNIDYEINLEDSYCRAHYNRFVRAWKAFLGKPIYYSGIYTDDKEKVKKWLNGCLKLVNETDTMPNSQVINLLYHIANNIDRIADNDEDAEVYIQAIETAINKLKEE